jgi:hypothetical protein
MNDEERKAYAEFLIRGRAECVEYLSVFEMADEQLGYPILDSDADEVFALIGSAKVTVSWE